ncbi:response regulator [Pseudogemmobacter sonorensis]|uniref:response regulator n=1 Tax=Pseudogemmobacter sonorensis TaxID=2989681 RepID=UPI0036B5B2F5
MIRILIADDHPIFRNGLALALRDAGDFEICGEATNADEALAAALALRPDLVLLDLSIPGGGRAALCAILREWPLASVAILTASQDPDEAVEALKAGAKGYLLKGLGSRALLDALRDIHRGEGYVDPTLAARILTRRPQGEEPKSGPVAAHTDLMALLTQREHEVLGWLAAGFSNKEIALRGDMQEKTVKHHVSRILQKLQVRNRTEAALVRRAADHSRA